MSFDRITAGTLHTSGEDLQLVEPCKVIAVIVAPGGDTPASAGQRREGSHPTCAQQLSGGHSRLLAALERVFPVRFERRESDELRGIDAALVLGLSSLAKAAPGVPRLVLAAGGSHYAANPARRAHTDESAGEPRVLLSDESTLQRPLRGQTIRESSCATDRTLAPPGSAVLASIDGTPVWWRLGDRASALEVSAFALPELKDGEALREHLRAGRFMGLLPLVHFLEQILGEDGWRLPPLRAAFVVDDPNLHWSSYGFLNYKQLVKHASRHGYHMSFATVPLDGWLVNRKAAALFAQNTAVLSLITHGNDHVARELGRLDSDPRAQAAIAQGLRRIAALERRSGVAVEQILAPPHGACSEAALRAAFRLGVDAACISRPHPWRDGRPAPTPVAGWRPADLVAGGLPVLPRYPLSASRDDLPLRAILGQPLILYGHHGDFADGLDVLEQAAKDVNALGDVSWGSVGWIARGNYSTRRLGKSLLVGMHSRRIALEPPPGAASARIFLEEPHGGASGHRLVHARGHLPLSFAAGMGVSEPLALESEGVLELTLAADAPLSPEHTPAPAPNPWPLVRRALVEARDRLQALL